MVRVYSIPLAIGVAVAGVAALWPPCERHEAASTEVIAPSDIVEVVIIDEPEGALKDAAVNEGGVGR